MAAHVAAGRAVGVGDHRIVESVAWVAERKQDAIRLKPDYTEARNELARILETQSK
jgi:hypothetical protein